MAAGSNFACRQGAAMSDAKREQLIAEGKLRKDGTRIERCPVCTQELPEGFVIAGSGAGEGETVEASAEAPAAGSEN
jgi:hypothetical protein